jgi:hypothetical protein
MYFQASQQKIAVENFPPWFKDLASDMRVKTCLRGDDLKESFLLTFCFKN